MNKNAKLTFLGTGTSQGVPVIACDCSVCKSENSKDKRLRSSVMFTVDDKNIVVDTGPDFRQQMLRGNVQNIEAILYTHAHKDHTAGLDDVRAFNFKHKKDMPIFCEQRVFDQLRQEYSYIFDNKFDYPGIPKVTPTIINDKSFYIDEVKIIPIRGLHYKLPVLGFRIGNIAYTTDMNQIPETEFEKLRNLDVFVINALRKEKHLSHFNVDEALEIIERVKPKKAYLTHVSHHFGLYSEEFSQLPDNVFISYDGMIV